MKYNFITFTALLLASVIALSAADTAKPNVVYLLADDLGWSDISAHPGGSIPSPNIDKLFAQGVDLGTFADMSLEPNGPARIVIITIPEPGTVLSNMVLFGISVCRRRRV